MSKHAKHFTDHDMYVYTMNMLTYTYIHMCIYRNTYVPTYICGVFPIVCWLLLPSTELWIIQRTNHKRFLNKPHTVEDWVSSDSLAWVSG